MQVAYQIHADELDLNFIESIKTLFRNRNIHINITAEEEMDETEYLLSSPANARRLREAINTIEKHPETLIHKKIEELG